MKLGIDFGTTRIVVAAADRGNYPLVPFETLDSSFEWFPPLVALRGDERLGSLMSACLARHGLPRVPADLGLSHAEFTKAVLHAPATRPGRYTILERLALDECEIARQVEDFAVAVKSEG